MEFLILGPLEVRDERGAVPLGGAKRRALLGVLLLHANSAVSGERLAVALWGPEAPARAVKTVQVHVSRLRKALGDERIETSAAGYRLRVHPGELDAARFEHLAGEGRSALAAGDAETAAERLRGALDEWRGPPLSDLADEPFAATEVARLEEERVATLELRIEAELELGREAELIGELQRLAADQPTRERLAEQLMLALYRCGRQTEALQAFRDARRRLVAESGVEPGPGLRRLQTAILQQDPALLRTQARELPLELERAAESPLAGRTAELDWLRRRWQRVRAGAGMLVTVRGESGIGKRRLAAELAAETHARGAVVLYADGAGPTDAALDALTRAGASTAPTVLVVDHAERAPLVVREQLAALAPRLGASPVLAMVLDGGDGDGNGGEALRLAPLDRAAVKAIVSRYAGEDEPAPDEWLLDASRGVPRLVHELAGQWVRRQAAARVESGVERTAARRTDLRTLERELAADVVALEAARNRDPPAAGNGGLTCPFKGLASFQLADAPYFFGRERLVAELVARLVGAPLLGIVGPSGSGKSSVLRAGLVPALASGVLPGSADWPQVLIRPGAHPLRELHRALARVPDGPVVIAVDQFEEIFTVCTDERESAEFAAELAARARASDGAGAIALAMRADFYGRCAQYPELARMLATSQVLVGAMRADELRRAVECPAQRAGLIPDPELVDALVADVRGAPGALPLLSTALLELWQRRDGRHLRHAVYERAGGVHGAVARLGEDAFARLDEAQRAVARRVLLRLATVADDGAVERRRVERAELAGADAEVVNLLADRRLLTVDAQTVELAHEALLREWPRLRGWIQEDQDALRVHRGVASAAREWRRLDRDDGALLRGARLAEAREWVDPEALAPPDSEFLTASLEREERERTGRRRRLELLAGTLAIGLVVVGIVALVAIHQRREAERARDTALAQSLAVQSVQLVDVDSQLALRLALWADRIAPGPQPAAALRQAALSFRQLAAYPADLLTAETAAYSPDGRRILTGGDTGVVHLYDTASRRPVAVLHPGDGRLMVARYSPRGDRIALGFADGTVLVTTPELRARRTVLADRRTGVGDLAFSRDGERLVVGRTDGHVLVVPVDGGPAVATLDAGASVLGVDTDGAGRIAAADEDGGVRIWPADASAPPLQLRPPDGSAEQSVRFSPDGRRLAAVGDDGTLRVWNAGTGAPLAHERLSSRVLTAVAFSRDGSRLATAGEDGAVRVFGTAGVAPLLVIHAAQGRVLDVGFGAGRDRVVGAGDDGTTRTWDAGGTRYFIDPAQTDDIEFSRTGRWIATGSEDGAARVWDAATGALVRVLRGRPAGYTPVRFSPVADELLIARDGASTIERWPITAPRARPVVRLPKGTGVNIARFDPTGTRIVYAGDARPVIAVRDLRSGHEVHLRHGPSTVWDARVSPDGREVAVASERGQILIWRLDRPGAPIRRLVGHEGHINAIAYARDGRIASAGADSTVRVWNPRTGRAVVLRGHTDEVTGVAFTPDGRFVVSTSADGTARLWNAAGGDALAVLQSGSVPVYDVAIARDGTIATLDGHEVVRVFRCPVCGTLGQVRTLADSRHPRALTAAERRRYLSDAG